MFPSILISDLEFTATETLVDTCDMNVYFWDTGQQYFHVF